MTESFDAYYHWLGIAPKDQPPHHYRLLGIELFEANPVVIENAAERQTAHLRARQIGKRQMEAERLLNELSQAQVCLLTPEKKSAYDARLRKQIKAAKQDSPALPVAQPLADEISNLPSPSPSPPKISKTSQPNSSTPGIPVALIAAAAAGVLLLGGMAAIGALVFWWTPQPVEVAERDADLEATEIANPAEGPIGRSASDAAQPPIPSPTSTTEPAAGTSDGQTEVNDTAGDGASNESNHVPTLIHGSGAADEPVDDAPESSSSPIDATIAAAPDAKPVLPEDTETSRTDDTETAGGEQPADSRLAVPDQAVRSAKRDEINEIFQVPQAKTAEDRQALAGRLLETAGETKNDPGARFALLNAARELAVDAGDIRLAFQAIAEMDAFYQIDAEIVKVASLKEASKATMPTQAKQAIVAAGLEMIDQFLANDEYEKAGALTGSMQSIARDFRDRDGLSALVERRRRGKELFEKYQQVQTALAQLEQSADDEQANLAVGEYLAFFKGQWERALPMLAKGSDARLAEIAKMELASPEAPVEQDRLANAWWDAAEKRQGDLKQLFRTRAAQWYREAEPQLSGLNAARAKQRLNEVEEVAAVPPIQTRLSLASAVSDAPKSAGDQPRARTTTTVTRVQGVLFFEGDDVAELRVNGIPVGIAKEKQATTKIPVELKVGDKIAVKVRSDKYEHGFRLIFLSLDRKRAFFTNRGTWGTYIPTDETQWWNYDETQPHTPASLADIKTLVFAEAKGSGAQPIWGTNSNNKVTNYLSHVVDEADFAEWSEIDYEEIDRGEEKVKGILYGSGDDYFDLAINGIPVLGGNQSVASTPVEIGKGDVICVRAMDRRYDKGFICAFVSEDGRVKFGSNADNWYRYNPTDGQRWFKSDPRLPLEKPRRGDAKHLALAKDTALLGGATPAIAPIWGEDNHGKAVHLVHVVDEMDLKPE